MVYMQHAADVISFVLIFLFCLCLSGELVEQAFKVFEVLTAYPHFLDYLTEDNLIALFQAMQYHEDCSDVQSAGLSFLLELAKNTEFREYLISNDIDDVILRAQTKHSKHDVVQKKCIEVFQLLCESLFCFYSNNESKLFICK